MEASSYAEFLAQGRSSTVELVEVERRGDRAVVRLSDPDKLIEFYVGGEQLDGRRAAELGLVNEVVPGDELIDRAMAWCDRIAELPAHALPLAKPLLRSAADASWEQALAMEEFAEPICFTTRGFAEGVERVVAATAER